MPPKGSKMTAPVRRDPSVEHSDEYDSFIKELADYHEKRGTTFEAVPKVGTRHLDLHKLYRRVVGEGGYDLVSDTKAKPLMWRKVAEEFLGKGPHLAAQAFMVKSAYYRNLVAYEITNHWHKEPPPKEILEDVTAKGGNVMGRTLDNFERPHTREEGNLANGNSSDADVPEQTPKQEKAEAEDLPGSATGARSSRGLRQAPPQRVLFNPDTNPSRQSRNASNHVPSPSPGQGHGLTNGPHNPSYLPNGTSMTLANYEPRQQYPLSLKPVTTPANNPEHYKLKRKMQQDAEASHVAKKYKGLMLPGTGFIGPNIYVRAQLALQSGIPEEEQYALHHLVKISHERGDKYRFDQFAGLAEALVAKVLQISSLFYDVQWTISYDPNAVPAQSNYLDGINGTPDVLKKLKSHIALDTDDLLQSYHFTQELGRITEAALVIRNMVMLEENARYISTLPLIRDYMCIVLNLKPHPAIVEVQNYALETAEQLTKFYDLDSQDVFYHSLLEQLHTSDRGKIIPSLKAISRLGMYSPTNKRLEHVPLPLLKQICNYMMIEDEELRSACLDFLFQYTSIPENVQTLLDDADLQILVRQLSSLLLFQAKEDAPRPSKQQPPQPVKEDESTQVPRLAPEIIRQLLRFTEPERSSHWLRMCFQDDPVSEMTQIHLWQSYQGTFLPYATTHPHLIAGDFIKNVSNTFSGASAQVAENHKYVIKGIKPRSMPVDYKGRELIRCRWHSPNPDVVREYGSIFAHSDGDECGGWFGNSDSLHQHILATHLRIPRKTRGSNTPMDHADPNPPRPSSSPSDSLPFDYARVTEIPDAVCHCDWSNCVNTKKAPTPVNFALLARHIHTHLPDTSENAAWKKRHHIQQDLADKPEIAASHVWQRTIVDEANDAAGIALNSALVLRNIAKALPRLAQTAAGAAKPNGTSGNAEREFAAFSKDSDSDDETGTKAIVRKIFGPSMPKLFEAMAHNAVLKTYVGVVLQFIAQAGR